MGKLKVISHQPNFSTLFINLPFIHFFHQTNKLYLYLLTFNNSGST